MTKRMLAIICVTAFGFTCFEVGNLFAAASPPGAQNAQNEEPLQMIVDYGQGPPKHRESHHGVVEPIRVPIGQQVSITLKFLPTRAGQRIAISSLDGGALDIQQPATISSNGSVTFGFNPGRVTGRYLLFVYGGQQYEIHLYAFDPATSAVSRRH